MAGIGFDDTLEALVVIWTKLDGLNHEACDQLVCQDFHKARYCISSLSFIKAYPDRVARKCIYCAHKLYGSRIEINKLGCKASDNLNTGCANDIQTLVAKIYLIVDPVLCIIWRRNPLLKGFEKRILNLGRRIFKNDLRKHILC